MSRDERLEKAVVFIRDKEFKATIIDICKALSVPRQTVYRRLTDTEKCNVHRPRGEPQDTRLKEADVVLRCQQLRLEHPLWGYRRMWANLTRRQSLSVSRNRVYRIMKAYGLLLDNKRFKPVRSWRPKIRAVRPNQYWGTDMSKVLIPGFGWLCFVVVIDWFTKTILGLSVGHRGDTGLWLKALHEATLKAFPKDGVRGKGVSLISDNGSQPTSHRYMAECVHLEIEQIFTTYDNPKGNADTERVIRTIKEEGVWPYEHETPQACETKLRECIEFYNTLYCHSSLGYKSPMEFHEAFFNNMRPAA